MRHKIKTLNLLKELRDSKKTAAEKLEQVEAKQLRTVESPSMNKW